MKKIKMVCLLISAVLMLNMFCACSLSKEKTESKKIIAVAIVPVATFVEEICSDEFEIVTMIPPGASPETYEPSPYEMQKLEDSCIYFSIGVPAEENFILPNIKDKSKIVYINKEAEKNYKELMDDGGRDPHIWLSPKRVSAMIPAISQGLSDKNAENSDTYKANADLLLKKLNDLDQEITALFRGKRGGKFITLHPSFGYLADDYGLQMYSLEEHGREVNAKHMAEMANLAKNENIKTIFYQAESSGIQANAFAEEIGGKAVSLDPLSADYIANLLKMAKLISKAVN